MLNIQNAYVAMSILVIQTGFFSLSFGVFSLGKYVMV